MMMMIQERDQKSSDLCYSCETLSVHWGLKEAISISFISPMDRSPFSLLLPPKKYMVGAVKLESRL